jgi:hypothetical protein
MDERAENVTQVANRAPRVRIDAVVTDHVDVFRSGVARFNELLANALGVPLRPLTPEGFEWSSCPLLSFKFTELQQPEAMGLASRLEDGWSGELYLHEHSGSELERRAIGLAQRVHCGNYEIFERVSDLTRHVDVLWTPGLILDDRLFRPSEVSVFSFGMAHKIRIDMFDRLRGLLEAAGSTYSVYVSAANHETTSLRDAEIVFREMHDLFPQSMYFLGNLSDVAVLNYLLQTTFFAAFFPSGVRDNNTSVASAMERGAVVITNLDRHSPREFRHMDNVIDIEQCDRLPSDPLELKRLSVRAMETARSRSWAHLVEALRS